MQWATAYTWRVEVSFHRTSRSRDRQNVKPLFKLFHLEELCCLESQHLIKLCDFSYTCIVPAIEKKRTKTCLYAPKGMFQFLFLFYFKLSAFTCSFVQHIFIKTNLFSDVLFSSCSSYFSSAHLLFQAGALHIPDITCRHRSRHDMTSSFIIMIWREIYNVNKCDTGEEKQSKKQTELSENNDIVRLFLLYTNMEKTQITKNV